MTGVILLIEDNEQILRGNERLLKRQGYEVLTALTLSEARTAVNKRIPDAIVLDIMMPDGSGLAFMRELRQTSQVPILLLTGLATPADVVRGLSQGGDDYLTKPYDFGVLLARVEALLRRASQVPETLTIGALRFDVMANQAFLGGENLLLTQKEFAVLLLMVKNQGKALLPEIIYKTVWKRPMGADDQAVKAVMSRLRKKLRDPAALQYDNEEAGYVFDSVTINGI